MFEIENTKKEHCLNKLSQYTMFHQLFKSDCATIFACSVYPNYLIPTSTGPLLDGASTRRDLYSTGRPKGDCRISSRGPWKFFALFFFRVLDFKSSWALKVRLSITPLLCSYSAHMSGTSPAATATFATWTSTAATGTFGYQDFYCRYTAIFVTGTSTAASPTSSNDPPAGSPTETLLRLLLPLSDQVRSTSTTIAIQMECL